MVSDARPWASLTCHIVAAPRRLRFLKRPDSSALPSRPPAPAFLLLMKSAETDKEP